MASSISTDQEVHRDQHRFPEDVEEHQVQRRQRAQHRRLQEQERDAVHLDPLLDVLPRAEHDDGTEEGGEEEEEQRHPVEPDVIAEPQRRGPLGLLLERVPSRCRAEPGPERDREQEREQAEEEGDALVLPAFAARQERDQDGAEHREEGDDRQQMGLDEFHQPLTRKT